MKYPEYPADLERRQPLRGFLGLFAQMEGGVSSRHKVLGWSQQVAELSRLYINDDPRFKGRLNSAKRLNPPMLHQPLLNSMKFTNNHNEIVRLQRGVHAGAINELRNWRSSRGDYNTRAGRMVEMTALGLLTRYNHPWMLAAPALPHHERDDKKIERHFDIALAIGSPDNEEEAYYLQVKKACSGRCGNEAVHDRAAQYSPDIQLVSGCCDLGLMSPDGRLDDSVAKLLVAEYDDQATAEQIKYLDVLTDQLLFNTSADLLPRGTVEAAGRIAS